MSLRYTKIKKNSKTFLRLFGVNASQFEQILCRVEPQWQKDVIGRYRRKGRNYKLDLADMVLMLLLYYRSYINQVFVGYLFGIDDSRVCRIIQRLEPVLARVMTISKQKKLSQKDVEELIIDATEQPIERPKVKQQPYYSGKKKHHTIKTELRTTLSGRIVHVSKEYPGATHDFTIFKQSSPLPPNTSIFVDSGYQGIDQLHAQAEFPFKATKNKPLDPQEKEYNRALSRIRVVIENVIANIKNFKILAERYRNKRKRHNVKFNIIAAIVNVKNGFGFA